MRPECNLILVFSVSNITPKLESLGRTLGHILTKLGIPFLLFSINTFYRTVHLSDPASLTCVHSRKPADEILIRIG